MKLRNSKTNNSKGFSLIEMVVAFALLAVVVAAVGGFIITGVRSYAKNNNESSVQNEAQMALNQIESTVIDASLGVSYNVRTSADTAGDHFVLNDTGLKRKTPTTAYDTAIQSLAISGLTADQAKTKITDKLLYVFNWGADTIKDGKKEKNVNVLLIRWDPTEKKLYYAEPDFTVPEKTEVSGTAVVNSVSDAVLISSVTKWDLFAEGVEGFSCDLSSYDETGKINVWISLDKNGQTYATNGTITLRNDISVNASDMSEIYARADEEVETVITGVKLYTSADTIVKDGSVKLTTEVTGTGYPSKAIAKWEVYSVPTSGNITFNGEVPTYTRGSGEDVLVFDSADTTTSWPVNISNSTPRQLTLNSIKDQNDNTMTLLRITCYLSETDKNDKPYSYTRYVAVKELSNFSIQPYADLKADENLSLKDIENKWLGESYVDVQQHADETNYTDKFFMDVRPGNKIQMKATVDGNNLTDKDKKVVWTILPIANPNVKVSIKPIKNDEVEGGVGSLEIDKYSQMGTVFIQAYPELNPSMVLTYKVNIGNATAEGENALQILNNREMNRGESLQLGLKMNNSTLTNTELSDFNWTVEVQNRLGTVNNGASVASGLVTVSTSLSFDYSYSVVVTASLKSNPEISTSTVIPVPKVTLTMSPTTYVVQPGTVIPEGTIKCIVTGIASYDLEWAMASSTNPNVFGGTAGNGSFVAKSATDPTTAKISISSREPSSLAYMRVKASLAGYSNYYAQAYLPTSDVTFSVSATKTQLNRASDDVTTEFTASISPSSSFYNVNYTNWTIEGAKTASNKSVTTQGLSITTQGSKATFTLSKNYVISTEDIIVTVKAELNGKEASIQVTIKATDLSKFTIFSDKPSVNRGGNAVITTQNVPSGYRVVWEAISGTTEMECAGNDSSATLRIPADFYVKNDTDRTVTVKAKLYLGDQPTTAEKTLDITVPMVRLSLSRTGESGYYTYSAEVQNVANEADYEYVWKLVNSATDSTDRKITGYELADDYVNNKSKTQSVSVTVGTSTSAYIYVGLRINNGNTNVLASNTELIPTQSMLTEEQLQRVDLRDWGWPQRAYIDYNEVKDTNLNWLYRYSVKRYASNGVEYYSVTQATREKISIPFVGSFYSYDAGTRYYLANSGSIWYVWESNKWKAYGEEKATELGLGTNWSGCLATKICEGFKLCIDNTSDYRLDTQNGSWTKK